MGPGLRSRGYALKMRTQNELTDEERETLRKAKIIFQHVSFGQVTNASLPYSTAFRSQLAEYAHISNNLEIHQNREIGKSFDTPEHSKLGSWSNNKISKRTVVDGSSGVGYDLQGPGFPAYDYGQPAAGSVDSSHRDVTLPLSISSFTPQHSVLLKESPTPSPIWGIDTIVGVDAAVNPLQVVQQLRFQTIQLPASTTAQQSEAPTRHQHRNDTTESTYPAIPKHLVPFSYDAISAGTRNTVWTSKGADHGDLQSLPDDLMAVRNTTAGVRSHLPLHSGPSLVTAIQQSLASFPNRMHEMASASNLSPQHTETPDSSHLVHYSYTPLGSFQGPAAWRDVVGSSQGTTAVYQAADVLKVLSNNVDRPVGRKKSSNGPRRNRRSTAKRQPYSKEARLRVSRARKIGICILCRHVRKPCMFDPDDPSSECIRCQEKTFNIFRLPCLRYKIIDSILFRTMSNLPHESYFPMVGRDYGRFNIPKIWVDSEIKTLCITQDRGTILRLSVRRFQPPEDDVKDDKGLGAKGRRLFAVPWAMLDAANGLKSINAFINDSAMSYVDHIVARDDVLFRVIFEVARKFTADSKYGRLVANALRFWTTCRFIEGGWRVYGEETLGAEALGNPLRPFEWVSPPPYVDYEFASTVMHKVLDPLRRKVLCGLQNLVNANKPQHWFCIFLVSFILLHNYELIMKHEVAFSKKRGLATRYVDLNLIRGVKCGANILLAHFRLVCKGHVPFQRNFDWTSTDHQRMAQLKNSEMAFLASYTKKLQEKCEPCNMRIKAEKFMANIPGFELEPVSLTDRYEDRYWFISQLFLEEWSPRETYDHAPPA